MGSIDLYELKQSFVKLVKRATPPQMPQFVIWLDVKLSEYKLNGYMTLDDEHTPGQTWMELLIGIPTETDRNTIRIKEEPPDNDHTETLMINYNNESRKSSMSDQGNITQENDPISNRSSEAAQLDDMVTGDSVSILRNTIQQPFSLQDDKHKGSLLYGYNWNKMGTATENRPYPAGISANLNISRPITLMDLKSSANIPSVSSAAQMGVSNSYQPTSYNDLQCHVCNKVLRDIKAYRRHMSAHRQPSDYPCNQCGRTFSLKMQLKRHNCAANLRHMQRSPTMSPTLPYASPPARPQHGASSERKFLSGGSTMMQPASSSILKMVACDECGRRFSRQQDLTRHVCAKPISDSQGQGGMSSNGSGSTNSEVMTLLSLSQLNKNRSSSDYPITCSGCGWSFSRRQDLRRHKCSGDIRSLLNSRTESRNNSSESPRPTDATGIQFNESDKYHDEDSSSMSPKPKVKKYEYMCAKCGSNFYTEDELQIHIDKCILETEDVQLSVLKDNQETADTDKNHAEDTTDEAEMDKEEAGDCATINYQGSGTNPTSNTGVWSLSENSPGPSCNNGTKSKRKKKIPQKVEAIPLSPGTSEGCNTELEELEGETISPGDVMNIGELVGNGIEDQMLVNNNLESLRGSDKVNGGRDSDGDTDEEMLFQVNKEGVITWQASSLPGNIPTSDMSLLSAYQLAQMGSNSNISLVTAEASITEPGKGVLLDNNTANAAVPESAVVAQGKKGKGVAATEKSVKRRRRNNNGPYECKVCHKLFAQSSSRNRHTKLHYGIYDYACNVCGRQFARKEHLKGHANKCPGTVMKDNGQRTPKTVSSIAPASSYGLLQESFGDVIMIQ